MFVGDPFAQYWCIDLGLLKKSGNTLEALSGQNLEFLALVQLEVPKSWKAEEIEFQSISRLARPPQYGLDPFFRSGLVIGQPELVMKCPAVLRVCPIWSVL